MALNPHQFVGQQLWHVRGTTIRGPIQVDSVEDDPNGFFIKSGQVTYPSGADELHSSEESARAQVQKVKDERKARKAQRTAVPKTDDYSQLINFLGGAPKKKS